MNVQEFISQTTTVITEGIWRVEVIHNTLDNEINVLFGTQSCWDDWKSVPGPELLTGQEFAQLLPLLNEANRIISKKVSNCDSLQQEEFQANATKEGL
jgi:hypothetical protein